jgi:hypothetical protein
LSRTLVVAHFRGNYNEKESKMSEQLNRVRRMARRLPLAAAAVTAALILGDVGAASAAAANSVVVCGQISQYGYVMANAPATTASGTDTLYLYKWNGSTWAGPFASHTDYAVNGHWYTDSARSTSTLTNSVWVTYAGYYRAYEITQLTTGTRSGWVTYYKTSSTNLWDQLMGTGTTISSYCTFS